MSLYVECLLGVDDGVFGHADDMSDDCVVRQKLTTSATTIACAVDRHVLPFRCGCNRPSERFETDRLPAAACDPSCSRV